MDRSGSLARAAVALRPLGAGRKRELRWEALQGYAFLTPALVFLIVFLAAPAVWIFWLSLTRWDLISTNIDYIGFLNYDRLFRRDELFWQSFRQTVYFTAVTVPAGMAVGLLLALLLNAKMAGRDFMRAAIFSPYVMPLVATVLIWGFMFYPDSGILNALLHLFGLPKLRWLDDSRWVMPAIMLYSVWHFAGYNAVIFLSGLSNIPAELEEAARVDGAGNWTRFWTITWPLLSPTTYFVLLISMIGSFKVVQPILVFTGGVGGAGVAGGGPDKAAETIGYYAYIQAFGSFHAGYSGAISVVLFLIILAITGFQMGFLRRRVFYG